MCKSILVLIIIYSGVKSERANLCASFFKGFLKWKIVCVLNNKHSWDFVVMRKYMRVRVSQKKCEFFSMHVCILIGTLWKEGICIQMQLHTSNVGCVSIFVFVSLLLSSVWATRLPTWHPLLSATCHESCFLKLYEWLMAVKMGGQE